MKIFKNNSYGISFLDIGKHGDVMGVRIGTIWINENDRSFLSFAIEKTQLSNRPKVISFTKTFDVLFFRFVK